MNKYSLLICILFLYCGTALAHNVNIFVISNDTSANGEVYFNDGKPCSECKIDVVSAEGVLLKTDKSHTDGSFDIDWSGEAERLIVHAGMGHQASYIMDKPRSKSSSNDQHVINDIDKRVAMEVKVQIDAYKASRKIPQIISGLGYILGIFGLWALLKKK